MKDKLLELQSDCRWKGGDIDVEKAPEELRRHIYKCCHSAIATHSMTDQNHPTTKAL